MSAGALAAVGAAAALAVTVKWLALRRRTGRRPRPPALDDGAMCVEHVDGQTRARCLYVMLGGPVFQARRDPAHGSRGEACGEPFHVDGSADAWTPLAHELSRWLPDDMLVFSDGRELVAVTAGTLDDRKLEVVLDLLAELARHQVETLEAMIDAAGEEAAWEAPAGPWDERSAPSVIMALPATVHIGPAREGARVVTCARAAAARATPSFTVKVGAGGEANGDVEAARGLFPAAHAQVLAQLAPCAVSCDGSEVRLSWPGIEGEVDKLLAAARFVGALAAGPGGGVFR